MVEYGDVVGCFFGCWIGCVVGVNCWIFWYCLFFLNDGMVDYIVLFDRI